MEKNDKELIKRRFAAHLESYHKQSVVQQEVSSMLFSMMTHSIDRSKLNNKALEIGAGTGFLTSKILSEYNNLEWIINDLVEQTAKYILPIIEESRSNASMLFCDAENVDLPTPLSLIVSSSAVQWFDSLENFLVKTQKHLSDGGYFAFSTFGKDNFFQVKEASKIDGINYPDLDTIINWSQKAGFKVISSHEYKKDICFNSAHDVLRYIKETGLNGNSREKWTRSDYERFCEEYKSKFSNNNSVILTFNPMLFILSK